MTHHHKRRISPDRLVPDISNGKPSKENKFQLMAGLGDFWSDNLSFISEKVIVLLDGMKDREAGENYFSR